MCFYINHKITKFLYFNHKKQKQQYNRGTLQLLATSLGFGPLIYDTRPVRHQLLEQWFKSYDAICADGGHLGFLRKWTIKCF